MRWIFAAIFLLGWTQRGVAESTDDAAARVVILANANDADSTRVADYYAAARGVPKANIFALPMSAAETISWPEFVRTIWQPLQDALVEKGWISGVTMDLLDSVGRKKNAVSGHRISYLVVCRGVPLRVDDDPALRATLDVGKLPGQVQTMRAAVDSELALLARVDPPAVALVPNPLFNRTRPSDFVEGQVVKVSRLEGPTLRDTLALVDHAIEAEKHGVVGRAYVDLGGPHKEGDTWIEATIAPIAELGFETDVDRARGTMPVTARCDAPAIYFGWYAGNLNGPFALPDFRFAPGAIALHIHSYSALTLRSASSGWTGPLVARGVTATVGNVFEPYLDWTHRPDILMLALARGERWGDAVFYALPALSWQAVAIGDPLYRPFARTPDEIWKGRANLPASLVPYAALREMAALDRQGRQAEALELGLRAERKNPGLALALSLAERLDQKHDRAAAVRMLGVFKAIKRLRTQDLALAAEAAKQLSAWGAGADAVQVCRNLIADAGAGPAAAQRVWAREAAAIATAAGEMRLAQKWQDAGAEPAAADAK
ncbi:TIGR03790 family protein [Horticoccus luteus]|uniref:TIGR03790 family protein n=1 Tax=Horticoccus luteus TaxID=2862869 RepID=A0A8F9TSY7_9BACT|nr:TIGR03790 family protein [Horticoccus luteus]QYM77540.1 TIGR03790 family protein [Horticoccus luteus]